MTDPERRRRIEDVCDGALDRDAPERAAFVAAECADDEALRRDVDALLAHAEAAEGFLETPVGEMAALILADEHGTLVGRQIGSYRILSLLGAGGMGEVYRARDNRLGRDVAFKVVPDRFISIPGRLARFELEARVLATLNHPHIGAIYGLEEAGGVRGLVLELVEGTTLAERLAESPLSVPEALAIARQIADGLEAAHDKGIVHRDLKPANVKITSEGTVKVLDFGLAKVFATEESRADASQRPADATQTQAGLIAGTAAYMSPEQARGKAVDKRTDIWAFGCVLYEMLTGRGIFGGDTPSETVAAVLDRVPDWRALPAATPSGIRRLLQRCLDRDPRRRLHDIADARLEIDDAIASPAAEPLVVRVAPSRRVIPLAIAALAGGAVIALLSWATTRPSPRAPEPPSRFAIVLPASEPLNLYGDGRSVALSPDGRHIVYRAGGTLFGGPLMLRDIDQLDARPLGDMGDMGPALGPFFSPDSLSIGFFSTSNFEQWNLMKVAIRGGPAVSLCPIVGMPLGASWGDDNTIVFATEEPGVGLRQVSASGGQPTVLTRLDTAQGEKYHLFPSVLPGGRGVLFTIDTEKDWLVAILDRKTGQRKTLFRGGSDAEYVESGHLIYAAAGTLRVVGFDPVRLEVLGDPVPVAETVMTSRWGAAHYAVSRSGTLMYAPGGTGAQQSLVWVDRKGREEPIRAPARAYYVPRLSPDGTRVVVTVWDPDADLWIWDLARDTWTRLTIDPANDLFPVWTPDSRRIIFASARDRLTVYNLYSVAADGAGTVERVTTSTHWQIPRSITPDGTRILGDGHSESTDASFQILMIPLMHPSKAETLFHTPFNALNPEISPNGRYLAYTSGDSIRAPDVYVRPYPHVDRGVWKVTREGETRAMWARNGRELFYLDGSKTLMAVPVDTSGPTFSAGTPVKVFDAAKYSSWYPPRNYDVSPDGQRFLMIKDGPPAQLIVVQRFFEDLKARVAPPRTFLEFHHVHPRAKGR